MASFARTLHVKMWHVAACCAESMASAFEVTCASQSVPIKLAMRCLSHSYLLCSSMTLSLSYHKTIVLHCYKLV